MTSREVGAALRDMKNGKMYTKCLSERRIPTACKNAKILILFKKGTMKNTKMYNPI